MKFTIIGLLFVALLVIVGLLNASKGRGALRSYKRKQFMTDNEREFFGRLLVALPDHFVFPQVAMSAFMEASSTDRQAKHSDRMSIAQKHVDYLVCDSECEIVAVVELDDRTHSAEKDRVRDERLLQAGIRTVRFQSRNKPAPDAIRAAILPVLPTLEAQAKPATA